MCQPEIIKLALVLKSLAKKHGIPPEANVEFLIPGCLNAGSVCLNMCERLVSVNQDVTVLQCN